MKALAWLRGKPLAIIAMVALPLAGFLIVMGHINADKESLIMGYSCLAIAVWNIAVCISLYFTVRKLLFADFAKYAQDGKINYCFERTGDTLKIIRRNDGFAFTFNKSDIKKTGKTKIIVVLFLKDKRIVTLPHREDILQLLNEPMSEENYEESNHDQRPLL
ncbi:MAG: hypothetical protein IJX49_00255 [Clostridia bacterium]|nr:hypothetical protein [Clostridia bacterium]